MVAGAWVDDGSGTDLGGVGAVEGGAQAPVEKAGYEVFAVVAQGGVGEAVYAFPVVGGEAVAAHLIGGDEAEVFHQIIIDGF
jgi:hypothetical protein